MLKSSGEFSFFHTQAQYLITGKGRSGSLPGGSIELFGNQMINYQANPSQETNHGECCRLFFKVSISWEYLTKQNSSSYSYQQQAPFQGGWLFWGFKDGCIGTFLNQCQSFFFSYHKVNNTVNHGKERDRDQNFTSVHFCLLWIVLPFWLFWRHTNNLVTMFNATFIVLLPFR